MSPQRTVKQATGKRPKLGQNFLADKSAAQKIVDALGDISNRLVVEIGPGRGAITRTLVDRAGKLIAVEFDRILAAQLRMELATRRNLEIIEGDVLSLDFDRLVQGVFTGMTDRQPAPELRKAHVVGNLPYYITSDILLKLFKYHVNFDTIVIMVQKEVADRIAAQPGSRDYGLLTVTTQLYSRVEKLFTLPPGAFAPPPKVYSTVLRLKVEPQLGALGVNESEFIAFLKLIFAQKRKTFANNLKQQYGVAAGAALKSAGLRADVRAEAVPVAKLAAIYRALPRPQ